MRWPRYQIRHLMAGVSIFAATLALAAGIHRRGDAFRRLAAYHLQAEAVLTERAGGPLECSTGLTESDVESIFCGRGAAECRAYRAAMHHYELSEKYRRAAERPWLPIAADPPAPPGANPEVDPDPRREAEIAGGPPNGGFE